ncbi:MAG: hypothetical protein MUC68_14830 [Burkholderiaceae bacterium]|nr:hypothetical protein [Burkholderiaceae bacterium]
MALDILGGVSPLSLLQTGSALGGQYDDQALLTGKQGLLGGAGLPLPSLAQFDLFGLGKASADVFAWMDDKDIDKYVGFVAGTSVGTMYGGELGGRVGGNLGAIAGDQAGTDVANIARRLWG